MSFPEFSDVNRIELGRGEMLVFRVMHPLEAGQIERFVSLLEDSPLAGRYIILGPEVETSVLSTYEDRERE